MAHTLLKKLINEPTQITANANIGFSRDHTVKREESAKIKARFYHIQEKSCDQGIRRSSKFEQCYMASRTRETKNKRARFPC